jgi:hypothetical protein
MAAAVLVGLANAALYSMVGDEGLEEPFTWKLEPWPLTILYAVSAIMAALSASDVFLRFARRDLQGSFFARYDLMVLALCIGGVVLSLLLTAVTGSLDDGVMVPSRPLETLQLAVCALVVGGILGAIEGVILAFSLAWLLGLFRDLGLSPLDHVARVDLAVLRIWACRPPLCTRVGRRLRMPVASTRCLHGSQRARRPAA